MEAVHALKSALTEQEARSRRKDTSSLAFARLNIALSTLLRVRASHEGVSGYFRLQVLPDSDAGKAAIKALKATIKACGESSLREDRDIQTVAHFGLVRGSLRSE